MNTHSSEQKPVIFLAFANDRVNGSKYLRNLPVEQRGIRNALEKAKQAGLCDVIERSNASIDDILDVFQDESYKDRIAIFHYGGHADDYKLLLEAITGGRSYAFKEGLVSFLSRQKGLKLIFLNGCSTVQLALELKEVIPVVIGTCREISDEVAAKLAIRFYHGIANGHSLERAWREAEDEIKSRKDSSNFNNMYHWEQQEKQIDRFPWDIFFKEGAENVREWNLPDAVDDPLFGIPAIPGTYGLPETPFLFLRRYEEKYARVFFGRGQYIHRLYNRVVDPGAPPIILFYGQSGVGKSSLLEAGLLPRLEESHTVLYIRREQEKSLLRTLEECLPCFHDTSQHSSFITHHSISCPLVIILDQVEEIFTRPNPDIPNELEDFLEKMQAIFASSYKGLKIKLILGYRKEYHPEIDKHLGLFQLPRSYLFLEPLCRKGIIEAVTGITRSSSLKLRYHNLEVETDLPGIIADELLADRNSPIAPVLQILLTKMWIMAIKENSHHAVFSLRNYRELRKQGLAMEDFLRQQTAELKKLNPEVVNSGLALDLLKFHTTRLGTACGRGIDEIRKTYPHSRELMNDLVKQLKNFYLLTDTQHHENETSLAHDTLAPVVINEYNDSDKPGQRAARILAARIEDFKKDANAAWLNEADLPVVDQGKNGMKALTPIEEELLKQSKNKKAQRERQIKRFKVVGVVLLTLFIIAGLIAGWQWQVASIRARKINIDYQAAQAQLNVEKDPTTALRLVEKAWQLDKNEITTAAISKIYRENSFYKIIAQLEQEVKSVFFSRDGQTIIAEFESGNQRAWNWQDGELQEIKRFNGDIADNKYPKNTQFTLTSTPEGIGHLWEQEGNKFRNLDFIGHEGRICPGSYDISPDEKYVLTGSEDKTARLWDLQGNPLEVFRGHESAVTSVAISSDGRYILTAAGNTLRLWELKDKELKSFDGHGGEVDSAVFSSDGQHLLIGSTDGTVRLWDLQGNQVKEFNGQGAAAAGVAFSKEKYIAAGFKDGSVRLWDLAGKELWNIKRNGFEISAVAFSPDGQRILIGSYDKTAWLLDLNGKEIQVFKGHKNRVTAAVFSPDGKYILTGSYDKTARLWNSAGKEQKAFKGHNNFVTSVAFSPDGRYILTGSFDQTVRLWDKEANELMIFKGHGNIIHSVAFSPGGQYILTGSADKTACLWDCQGNQIQVFKGHEGAVRSVGFSPDGRSVLSGSVDGTVRLWKIYPLDEFLNSGVCERLSSEQLKKYGIAD